MTLFITVLLVLIVIYGLCKYTRYLLLYTLPVAEAGPIESVPTTGIKHMPQKIKSSYKISMNDGTIVKYRCFFVQGNCMSYKGIYPGEVINVRTFNSENDKKKNIKPGDIVLIYLNDKSFRGYKIRSITKPLENEAETHYYNEHGETISSSKNHSYQSIKGIIEGKSLNIEEYNTYLKQAKLF